MIFQLCFIGTPELLCKLIIPPSRSAPSHSLTYSSAALNHVIRNSMIRLDGMFWGCAHCDFKSKYQSTVGYHIEAKHFPSNGVQCEHCSTLCPTRQALKMHISRKHRAITQNEKLWFSDLKDLIDSKIDKTPDSSWMCLDCGKTSKWKTNIVEHIEGAHIECPGYNCDVCNKFCKTRNALRSHKHREHKNHNYFWILFIFFNAVTS